LIKSKILITAAVVMLSTTAYAADVSVSGFVRQEMSYKLTSDENTFNQGGNAFNGKTVISQYDAQPITRSADFDTNNNWGLMATRAELDFQIKLSNNWDAFVKVRGFWDHKKYDDFSGTNFFEVPLHGDCGTALEICGDDYMVDLPSAYLDYNKGPLWLRIGNQQIAWGEALFFRVSDVANGLDLRRHSFVDWASEEYADERVASPAIRGSYRFNDTWEVEAYVQQFSPTIYGNENTPYNVIFSAFVIQQEDGFNKVADNLNTGIRIRGQFGDLGLQFFATSRRNPDGVFRWTESNINPFAGMGGALENVVGANLANSPFELDTQGVWTADEWYNYAGQARLDGATALDASILEFQGSQNLGAFAVVGDPSGTCGALGLNARDCAGFELDFFFSPNDGFGPLRGHLAREYPYENVFGWGFNHVLTVNPDSFFDQLVTRFEMSYTPDKKFTAPSLSRDYIEEDEFVASLVFEKYHRFTESFPATYMVLEYMFKSESDMYGRHLSGMDNDGRPKGDSNFHAFAFAFQQPSPSLLWRYDFALLYDANGGLFVQPGVRFKPTSAITIEAYVNYFYSDGGNDDIIESIEWADEIGLRIGYQF
jgi:hypothetical protein